MPLRMNKNIVKGKSKKAQNSPKEKRIPGSCEPIPLHRLSENIKISQPSIKKAINPTPNTRHNIIRIFKALFMERYPKTRSKT